MIRQEMLPLDSPALEELLQFRGLLFDEWTVLWDSLSLTEKDAFTHPVWVISWLRRMPAPARGKCFVHILREGQDLIGVLPLSIKARRMAWFTAYHLVHELILISSAPALPAKSREEAISLLMSSKVHFNRRPLMITFQRVDETNGILMNRGWILKAAALHRRLLPLEDGYEALHQRLGKNLRKSLRKKTRQVEREFGSLLFETLRQPEELQDAFRELIDMEMMGWKRDSRFALQRDQQVRGFLLSLMEGYGLSKSGEVLVQRLRIKETTLATLLAIQTQGTLYGMKTAYREGYAKYSPGHLLFDFIFREYCTDDGIRFYNSIDTSDWFTVWNPQQLSTFEVRLFQPGLRGWCTMQAVRAYRWIRRFRAFPRRIREAFHIGKNRLVKHIPLGPQPTPEP